MATELRYFLTHALRTQARVALASLRHGDQLYVQDLLELITHLTLRCHPKGFSYVPEVLGTVLLFLPIVHGSADNNWLRKATRTSSNSCKGDVHRLQENEGLYLLWKSPIQALH